MKTRNSVYEKCKTCLWSLKQGTPVSLEKKQRDHKIGILYLTPEERKDYELHVTNGQFAFRDNLPLSGMHYFLFGLDINNQFYGKLGFEWKDYGRGYFGHGSFMAGGYLKAAGEMYISDGKLRYISSNSGHYLPSMRHMRIALYQLYKQGIDISETILVLYNHQRSSPVARGRYISADFYNAMEFLSLHENDCSKLNQYAVDYKREIQLIRTTTNIEIARTDSIENFKPHRLKM